MASNRIGLNAFLAAAIFGVGLTNVSAQTARSVVDQAADRVKKAETIGSLGSDLFGDQTDMAEGTTTFQQTDVSLPTNSGLLVAVTRVLSTRPYDYNRHIGVELQHFGNWALDVPVMRGTFDQRTGWVSGAANGQQRCSTSAIAPPTVRALPSNWPSLTYGASDYWSGNRISIPGKGSELVLSLPAGKARPTDGNIYYATTKSEWRIRCLPSIKNGTGEGFVAVTPDGTKYFFDWMASRSAAALEDTVNAVNYGIKTAIVVSRREYFLYATRVEDRFGNTVTYNYNPASPHRLNSIVSSDGAAVSLNYLGDGRVGSVVANGRTWHYQYVGSELSAVVSPDNSRWSFSGSLAEVLTTTKNKLLWHDCDPDSAAAVANAPDNPNGQNIVMTHPSGARGTFRFRKLVHGVNNIPGGCNDPGPDQFGDESTTYPKAYWVVSLIDKIISGSGMADQKWLYRYEPSWSFSSECVSCTGATSTTRVTAPNGVVTRYVFGNNYATNAGLLLQTHIEQSNVVIRSVTNEYTNIGKAGYDPVHENNKLLTEDIRPLVSTLTDQDRVSYQYQVDMCGSSYCFDSFGRVTRSKRFNSLGYSKTDVTEYYDAPNTWVMGQPNRRINVNTGVVLETTEYNAQSLPWKVYSLGKLKTVLSYNTDGTTSSIADGKGNVTTVIGWKRGAPLQIRHPATAESPGGATFSAAIDDNGWISSLRNEVGSLTSYGYDAMGRLAKVVYPTGDNIAYNNTTFEFRALTDADWKPAGIVSGQWRHYENTGRKVKYSYYDALLRPVLTHTYDSSSASSTLRSTRAEYDNLGQVVFASHPSSESIPPAKGTRTTYDALGRVIRVADSEHPSLATATEYLAGLKVRTTNPRGLQTTTAFMAWDSPSYDLPILSDMPEGKSIDIVRHPQFGRTEAIRQRSRDNSLKHTRYYVYDGHGQLCKTIEPESGATVMGYDDADNLVWSAAGLDKTSYGSTTNCDQVTAYGSGRRTDRVYDSRNRITQLKFPDNRGNQVWTYEKDSLPSTITTYNDTNNRTPLVNVYNYNNRRLMTSELSQQPGWYSWNVGYGYDANANLSSESYPTGFTINYAPNALGQATQVRDAQNVSYASGISYHPNGAIKQFTYGNGIVHTMTQDSRLLPSRSTSSGGVSDLSYTYDNNDNVARILDNARDTGNGFYGRWMTYDGLDRLTSAGSCTFGGDCWHRFAYDALDNITSWRLGGVKDYASYIRDVQTNRLTAIQNSQRADVQKLTYDVQGNLASKNGQTYEFDMGNRLRGVTGKEYYQYDSHGRRVINWFYENNRLVLSMYSSSGKLMYQEDTDKGYLEYIYLNGSMIATRDRLAGVPKYHHNDALGSLVAVTNSSGQVVERNEYEPYGALINKPSYSGIGYTGHMMDGATGLTYMQQRYYDQSIGQFLSVDPVATNTGTGSNFNRYAYANNNPYKFVDPDGRKWVCPPGFTACSERNDPAFDVGEGGGGAISSAQSGVHENDYGDRIESYSFETAPPPDAPSNQLNTVTVVAMPPKAPRGSVANPKEGQYSDKQADYLMRRTVNRKFLYTTIPAQVGITCALGGCSKTKSIWAILSGALTETLLLKQPINVPTDDGIDEYYSPGATRQRAIDTGVKIFKTVTGTAESVSEQLEKK